MTKALVFVKNHSLSEMRSDMAATVNLAGQCGYATSLTVIGHPALSNDLAIAGGRSDRVTDDNSPSVHGVHGPSHGPSVSGQALGARNTAGVYVDGMTQNCATSSGDDNYAVKHNPWACFLDERARYLRYDVQIDHLGARITSGARPRTWMMVPSRTSATMRTTAR